MYVDGFVLPIPKAKKQAYLRMARKKVMSDKRLAEYMDPKKLPFDGKRMFWGGFQVAVDL